MAQNHPRKKKQKNQLRLISIPGKLTSDELQCLKDKYGRNLAAYCRRSVLENSSQLPAPQENRSTYLAIGQVCSYLHQVAQQVESDQVVHLDTAGIETLMLEMQQVQNLLLGK
jgi:hypothetical protein